jgi:hypothetical protein
VNRDTLLALSKDDLAKDDLVALILVQAAQISMLRAGRARAR